MTVLLYRFFKRVFDIIAALVGIIGTLPLWLIACVGIILSDPGPVLYKANRVGKDNRLFSMFKFRSMRIDRNANEASTRPDQSRIFPFGKFIRASKIDELPQLINILFGDMSVVGPRPAAKDQIEITRSGENAIVSSIKPGLTTPAALFDYIYGDLFEDEEEYNYKVLPLRLELDRYYINHQSLRLDLKMIYYTLVCIFARLRNRTPKRVLKEIIGYVDGEVDL